MTGSAATLIETATAVDDLLHTALTEPAGDGLLTDEQLLELAVIGERITSRLKALTTRTLASIEHRKATEHVHGIKTSRWLQERHTHASNDAYAAIREAVRTTQAGPVWQALAEAEISTHQARAIFASMHYLPPDLPKDKETAAALTMVQCAEQFGPDDLRGLGERLIEVIDPEHADEILGERLEREEAAARRNRELRLHPDGMGSTTIKGKLPLADGEKLAALLDALVDQNTTDAPPACGRYCPGPSCGVCGGRPSRAMRRADALMELCATYADANHASAGGADRARVNVTVDLRALVTGLGVSEVNGQLLSAQQLRSPACDADIIPMVLDSFGIPLDVGQLKRFFTRELRAALVARDGGCVFPGCDRPARLCDAHHITPWWWGGPTSLDNGVLLCAHHHALVEPTRQRLHNPNRWEVRINPTDRLPEFLPPRALDPKRRPHRHLRHRLRTTPIGPGGDDH